MLRIRVWMVAGAAAVELAALAADNDTVSAWVTGVKFARGANRDRVSAKPPPALVADFRTGDARSTSVTRTADECSPSFGYATPGP